MKPSSLREVRARAGGIELDLVPDGAADQRVHGLVTEPAEQVPEGEIDGRDRVQDEPLAPVEHRRAPHLVPAELELVRALALDEAGEVLLDEPRGRRAAGRDADPDRAVLRLDLDDQACRGR